MNIWYLHHYATPSSIAGLHRPFEFGKYFLEEGNKLTVFSSSYLHYADKNMITDEKGLYIEKNYDGIDTVFVKTCGYGSGVQRVKNMAQFYLRLKKVARAYLKTHDKPDVIIASSPHPLTMMAGLKIAKKLGVPCICEVRDFWPEVFFTGGKLKEKGLIGRILLAGEKSIYKRSDALVFLKEGDHTYIDEHKWGLEDGGPINKAKCFYINNGVDVKKFDLRKEENQVADDDLDDSIFSVVYCGAIRPVNNVGLLLDAAKHVDKDVRILIYGNGNCVDELKERINKENLTAVKMKGYIDNKFIPYVLSKSKVNVLNYSAEKYNWSRGNSSNKMFEYLASGKPIISTVKMGYDILEANSCGLSTEKCDGENIAKLINQIKNLSSQEYDQMCVNARKVALEYDMPILAKKYLTAIQSVEQKYKEKGEKK
ncbi:MAG: glycosyltransferase family 4 protein [Clostridia bacterium]|nr:glycosyltransferase family 4 protein [Clostridia bacterium]